MFIFFVNFKLFFCLFCLLFALWNELDMINTLLCALIYYITLMF